MENIRNKHGNLPLVGFADSGEDTQFPHEIKKNMFAVKASGINGATYEWNINPKFIPDDTQKVLMYFAPEPDLEDKISLNI